METRTFTLPGTLTLSPAEREGWPHRIYLAGELIGYIDREGPNGHHPGRWHGLRLDPPYGRLGRGRSPKTIPLRCGDLAYERVEEVVRIVLRRVYLARIAHWFARGR